MDAPSTYLGHSQVHGAVESRQQHECAGRRQHGAGGRCVRSGAESQKHNTCRPVLVLVLCLVLVLVLVRRWGRASAAESGQHARLHLCPRRSEVGINGTWSWFCRTTPPPRNDHPQPLQTEPNLSVSDTLTLLGRESDFSPLVSVLYWRRFCLSLVGVVNILREGTCASIRARTDCKYSVLSNRS